MQLFTIGLYQLNDDGSQKLDSTGKPIPTYSNTDVQGLGEGLHRLQLEHSRRTTPTRPGPIAASMSAPGFGEDLLPMQSFPSHHSTVEKEFLGVTIPASASPDPDGDLKIALDTLFNHPNLPPFFCRQLIQHLVTSNPSPAYVSRVASVFKDNGQGVRGDLKAVITAILLDPEARDSAADYRQSAVRQGARSAAALHGVGARLLRAVAQRRLLPRQHRRSDLGPRADVASFADGLQLVCSGLRSAGHEHRSGRACGAGDADDECDHRSSAILNYHAERDRRQRERMAWTSSRRYGPETWPGRQRRRHWSTA